MVLGWLWCPSKRQTASRIQRHKPRIDTKQYKLDSPKRPCTKARPGIVKVASVDTEPER